MNKASSADMALKAKANHIQEYPWSVPRLRFNRHKATVVIATARSGGTNVRNARNVSAVEFGIDERPDHDGLKNAWTIATTDTTKAKILNLLWRDA